MLKKILVASCLLVASMASQATIISHNGYTRAEGSNIVTGGGLEWLKWDVTKGYSINSALKLWASDGWFIATTPQMAQLFNAFEVGGSAQWSPVAVGMQEFGRAGCIVCVSRQRTLAELFGVTRSANTWDLTRAMFASDKVVSRVFWGLSDTSQSYVQNVGWFGTDPALGSNWANPSFGVALVRNITHLEPSPVPLPGSLSLLALGLVGLGIRRLQALRR